MANIIAFSGKARSGKSTAAEVVMETLPGYHVVSFAEPLKQMLAAEFPDLVTMDDLRNHKKKLIEVNGQMITVRQLMINFGRLYRAIDADYWVKKALRSPYADIVIDDVRYPNEISILERMGARIIRVERPGIELLDDPSETLLDNYQFRERLHNAGSKDDYRTAVRAMLTTASARP